MDEDLDRLSREQLIDVVKKLRRGIRQHRDSTGHELCWHHPALWGLLPEKIGSDSGGAGLAAVPGGAKAAQQYLAAGLVDEVELNVVPTLLGRGERLLDGVGDTLHGLELVRTVAPPRVVHLKFARR